MSETIIRLFDDLALAREAIAEVERAGLRRDAVKLISRQSATAGSAQILDSLVQAGVDQANARSFAQAIADGGAVLCVTPCREKIAAVCAAIDSVPLVKLAPQRTSYQVTGTSPNDGNSGSPSGLDITHERAR